MRKRPRVRQAPINPTIRPNVSGKPSEAGPDTARSSAAAADVGREGLHLRGSRGTVAVQTDPDMRSDWALLSAGDQVSPRDGAATRFSRRQLLQRSAVALGGIAGLGLLDPSLVLGSVSAAPRPIPGGFDQNFNIVPSDAFVHVLPPGIGFEMSTITDFNGVIGGSETRGTAHDDTENRNQYSFDCDMRFMRGVYVGLDGRMHNGSFGFI